MGKGVLIQPSFYEAMKVLPDLERLALYDCICEYSLNGTEPGSLSPFANSLFALMKPNIDSANRRYAASVANGTKGGAPKGNQNARKQPKNNQKTTQKQPKNKQDYDLDSDYDSDLDNDLDKECELDTPAPALSFGSESNVLLTQEQYEGIKKDFPDYEERIERLSLYMATHPGKKYERHDLIIRQWAAEDEKKGAEKPRTRLDWGSATERSYEGDQVPW